MRMLDYEHEHRKPPSLEAVAQLLSTMLYHKRFFPSHCSPDYGLESNF